MNLTIGLRHSLAVNFGGIAKGGPIPRLHFESGQRPGTNSRWRCTRSTFITSDIGEEAPFSRFMAGQS